MCAGLPCDVLLYSGEELQCPVRPLAPGGAAVRVSLRGRLHQPGQKQAEVPVGASVWNAALAQESVSGPQQHLLHHTRSLQGLMINMLFIIIIIITVTKPSSSIMSSSSLLHHQSVTWSLLLFHHHYLHHHHHHHHYSPSQRQEKSSTCDPPPKTHQKLIPGIS